MGEDRLKQFGEIKVSEIMITDPLYITPDEKISATELLMLKKKVGGLPVVNDHNKLIGIITQRDIRLARFAMDLESPNTLVKDLMTPGPFVVKPKDTIKVVLETFTHHQVERLPVVDDNNELIGLVLRQEILKRLYKEISL